MTRTIDPTDRPAIESKLAKMNRRAVKLGLPEVSAAFTEKTIHVGAGRSRVVLDVELTGERPVMAGWEFLARVEHTAAGNLVSSPPGSTADLSPWYDCGPTCDHCNHKRSRRDTFVLRQVDSGEICRVGRSCLVDFIGSTDAESAAMAALWGDFFPDNEDGMGWGRASWSVDTILAFACASVRVDGCYRKAGGTRDEVLKALGPEPRQGDRESLTQYETRLQDYHARQATADDAERGRLIAAWGREQTGNDYMHNVKVACSTTIATERTIGILVSVPGAYAREQGYQATKAAAPAKVSPKEGRYEVTGVVKSKRYDETWGTRKMLLVVTTPEGNWNGWTTIPAGLSPAEGDTVTLKATVKVKELGFAILSRPAAV